MTDPTQDQDNRPRWWLELDNGEELAVHDGPWKALRLGTEPAILLRLPASRAHDLSEMLDVYSQMIRLWDRASHISGREDELSTALHDAALAAQGRERDEHRPKPRRVSSAARLRAMAILQENRPWLMHHALIGVVDAAARWVDEEEDDLARGVLEAAGGDEAGTDAWLVLASINPPDPRSTG